MVAAAAPMAAAVMVEVEASCAARFVVAVAAPLVLHLE